VELFLQVQRGRTRQVGDLIRQLREEGLGIFLTSHDIHDVYDLSDRISVMLQGKLVGTVNKTDVTTDEVLAMIILGKLPGEVTQKDLAELRAFAKEELGIDKLEAWDVAFASEKLRERRYAFSAQEVKEYFPEPKVVDGLFRLIQSLFSGLYQKKNFR